MKLNRQNKLLIGLCTAAVILIVRLFCIQIIDDDYKLSAENNTPERALSTVRRALADAGFRLPLEAAPRNGLSRCFGREVAVCSE